MRLAPFLLTAAQLAACGGGGSSPPAALAPATSAPVTSTPSTTSDSSSATGTIVVSSLPSASSFDRRKPQYIPAGSYNAHLWIDSTAAAAASASCTSSLCSLPFSTTVGSHNFKVEIDASSYVVAAGATGNVSVFSGTGNNHAITLNGASAAYVVSADSCLASSSCTQTFAIEDHSANDITGVAFDTGSMTFSVVTDSGTSPGFITSGAALASPCAGGNAYTLGVQCSATGTFHIQAVNNTPAGIAGLLNTQLSFASIAYYSATVSATTYEYTCTGTTISDASGVITAS